MPSSWIERRPGRFRVRYRLGGGETVPLYAGIFPTMREARARRDWIAGELAALRVPDIRLISPETAPTLRTVAERWKDSRRDVAEGTRTTYTVNLKRILPRLGDQRLDELQVADVDALVAELHAGGCKRESIRKTLSTLAQVLDYAKVEPNPARDPTSSCPARRRSSRHPPPRSTSRPSSGSCRSPTGYRRLFSTRPGCASASSRR